LVSSESNERISCLGSVSPQLTLYATYISKQLLSKKGSQNCIWLAVQLE
jgi:hypothetical protein